MKIQLSDHFTTPRLLRFVFPSIVTPSTGSSMVCLCQIMSEKRRLPP